VQVHPPDLKGNEVLHHAGEEIKDGDLPLGVARTARGDTVPDNLWLECLILSPARRHDIHVGVENRSTLCGE
jgi:hypothetical protein